jgi:hypothetical protein
LAPRWIALALGHSLTAALLALTACGGDDDNATTSVTSTLAPGQTAAPTADLTDDTTSDDIAAELEALGNNMESVTGKVGKVTYTHASADFSDLIIYLKPPNSRYDAFDPSGSSLTYIQTPDATYDCSSNGSGYETCFQSAGSGTGSAGPGGPFAGLFSPALIHALTVAAQAEGIDINKSDETIAGTGATCYEGIESFETRKFCFSDSGILLLSRTTNADGTSGMTATAVSSDVSDSDFEPPYPVTAR